MKKSIVWIWLWVYNKLMSLFHEVRWYNDGMKDVWETDLDWVVWQEKAVTLEEVKRFNVLEKPEISYNQNHGDHKSCCTLYAPLTAISHITWYEFSPEEIEDAVKFAETRWYVRMQWWYTQSWVDSIVKRWNTNNTDNQMRFFKVVNWQDDDVINTLNEKWRPLVSSIRADSEWSRDREADGWIHGKSFLKKWWHAICGYFFGGDRFNDSYKWRKYNKYGVYTKDYLIQSGNFYPSQYVIFPLNMLDNDTNEELIKNIDEIKTFNSAMWNKTKDSKLRNYLHLVNRLLQQYKDKIS